MTSSEFTKGQIALACWRAAKGELHSVMLYVCMVFQNRANAGWYEGSLYQNATHWLSENEGDFPDERDPEFIKLLNKLEVVLAGLVPDKTDGAVWFYSKDQISDVSIPEPYKITTTNGNLIFIK